ncbi:MAG: hypothetical protein MUC72_07475 [Acidobacteria bacterium]|jgi:hypothetical protein|nr:hypothetical protein [Acidobacteriota bacterium]
MKKLNYNLARDRQVNAGAFALRAALLALAALLLGALALGNLAGRSQQDRLEREEAGAGKRLLAEMGRESTRLRREIAAWKKSLATELAMANSLIQRKSFSFIARLDLLESVSSQGIRVRQLTLNNSVSGRIVMAISARSLRELFALYRKLAPYELVIASETQAQGEYLVNLSFKVPDENL